ncbi:hypothetical protein HX864_12605 [Pseudomonas yamanorum]|uniref:hypothetical protein n=1 Tax=Pseudomonas yamanorum TaxID=515393 RepID=UPI0015A32606|nr:hypothetical protein [Pseudomonas yamanorum]NWD24109.1 hypothetical protein [Pseudomonas yamanorum]
MNGYPTLASKCRTSGRRVLQAVRHAMPTGVLKRPRVRISFDIDDTLACQLHHSAVEASWLPNCVHRWWGEPLRSGTRSLTRELRRQGCSIWVYTSSGRAPSYIRRWLMLYGIRVDGVVNSVLHTRALTVRGLSNTPSKFPPAFDIDLHVDDSEGVRAEGHDHGFRVVVVNPQDENWAQAVLDAVAGVQAQLVRQQAPRCKKSVRPRGEVFSS